GRAVSAIRPGAVRDGKRRTHLIVISRNQSAARNETYRGAKLDRQVVHRTYYLDRAGGQPGRPGNFYGHRRGQGAGAERRSRRTVRAGAIAGANDSTTERKSAMVGGHRGRQHAFHRNSRII